MKAIKKKIITSTIKLFNERGVGNVRVNHIAEFCQISPGNLTYHYSTKKDLVRAVYDYVETQLDEFRDHHSADNLDDGLATTIAYLHVHYGFRFFFRDILELRHLYPEVTIHYTKRLQVIKDYNTAAIQNFVNAGIMIPEPENGVYASLARISWAIYSSRFAELEMRNARKIDINEAITEAMHLFFPYFTELGKQFYRNIMDIMEKEDLSKVNSLEHII